jgi:hypothetical protein
MTSVQSAKPRYVWTTGGPVLMPATDLSPRPAKPENRAFAKALVAQRKALHLNQDAAASNGGVSRVMWSSYERAASLPNVSVIAKLQQAGFNIDLLLKSLQRGVA